MPIRHKARKPHKQTATISMFAVTIASALLLTGAPAVSAAPIPKVGGDLVINAPGRTQISFQHSPTGIHAGTANEHQSRPGLSIVKMYIADYVFLHGTKSEKGAAYDMLRTSNDNTASWLYGKYPNSINATARAYGLRATFGAAHWGNSRTSTYDSVKYLEAKKRKNPKDPVLRALATATPVAADGYRQNFGTARLPGAKGTKFGWSDDRRSFHATATYGDDYTVAAATNGTAQQLTDDVLGAFLPGVTIPAPPQLPAVPTSSGSF